MEIMVSKNGHGRIAAGSNQPQRFQRLPTSIDQITGKPQSIGGGVKTKTIEQSGQRLAATVYVTDENLALHDQLFYR